jgi:predicted enzyme related to lactoylglutathione lyase
MERIVHFEIPSDEPEKAQNFYKDVFGWKFEKWGDEEYYMATTGEKEKPGINGAIMRKRDPNQPVVNTIGVANLDESIAKIEKNGGQIVVPKMPVGDFAVMAYFKDTDGNIMGIYQELAKQNT